jgi:hypothetical protein
MLHVYIKRFNVTGTAYKILTLFSHLNKGSDNQGEKEKEQQEIPDEEHARKMTKCGMELGQCAPVGVVRCRRAAVVKARGSIRFSFRPYFFRKKQYFSFPIN